MSLRDRQRADSEIRKLRDLSKKWFLKSLCAIWRKILRTQGLSLISPWRHKEQERLPKRQEIPQEERLLWKVRHFRASLQTAPNMIQSLQKYTSSREILREVLQKRAETDAIRRYFRSGEKCSTLKRQESTRFTEMKSSSRLLLLLVQA